MRGAPDPRVAAVRLPQVLGAAAPRPGAIYSAADETAAAAALDAFTAAWQPRYPAIVRLWRAHWAEFTPFLAFPPEVRRVIYTTNLIVILSFRVSYGRDLRRPVVDSVAEGTLAS